MNWWGYLVIAWLIMLLVALVVLWPPTTRAHAETLAALWVMPLVPP